jgi:hypothetical protein
MNPQESKTGKGKMGLGPKLLLIFALFYAGLAVATHAYVHFAIIPSLEKGQAPNMPMGILNMFAPDGLFSKIPLMGYVTEKRAVSAHVKSLGNGALEYEGVQLVTTDSAGEEVIVQNNPLPEKPGDAPPMPGTETSVTVKPIPVSITALKQAIGENVVVAQAAPTSNLLLKARL